MGKIRIYELAKELGVENKAVITMASQFGLSGKVSHSSSLDPDIADQVRRAFIRQAMGGAAGGVQERTEKDKATGATVTVRRKGNIIRRRREDEESSADAVEQQPTLDLSVDVSRGAEADPSAPTLDSIFKSKEEIAAERAVEPEVSTEQAEMLVADAAPEMPIADEVSEELIEPEGAAVAVEPSVELAPEAAVVEAVVVAPAAIVKKVTPGPRVLGKIELPKKKVVVTASTTDGSAVRAPQAAAAEEDDSKKKKGLREKRTRKKEFSRGDLVDYEGSGPRRNPKRRFMSRSPMDLEAQKNAAESTKMKAEKRVVQINEVITVGELAKAMSLKSGDVIAKLMQLGMLATINQAIDQDTATIVADEFGFTVESVAYDEDKFLDSEVANDTDLEARSPVVTVMGHVDHGKTSLLDTIRQASVAAKEHGGITQHIGAYRVQLESGQWITFIDTPGHAAFTSMRARGAQVTDIVILVVAADDGVMPQTIEAINHAKAAGVPIIVAVNKIDKPGINPDRVKQQLAEHGLNPEEWGGDTMFFHVSATKKTGIKELLEGILLQAEVKELRASSSRRASGTIIESRQDRGRGIVATVLVQKGTLRVGDPFVSGAESGRVRAMIDHDGSKREIAGPSTPVEITGFTGMPSAGDDFYVVESDSKAREVALERATKQQKKDALAAAGTPMSLEQFAQMASSKNDLELSVIIKGDVQGSVEAVTQSIEKLSNEKVKVKVIHSGVGGITESDIKLAAASRTIVVGFGVRAEPRVVRQAESLGVQLRFYNIIYELLDDIKKAMAGLLPPIQKESALGRAEVRNTFVIPKIGTVAGCFVVDGTVKRNARVRLLRDSKVIFDGKMSSLRRFKDDAREVQSGYECGIGIERYNDVKVGDVMEVYEVQEIAQTFE